MEGKNTSDSVSSSKFTWNIPNFSQSSENWLLRSDKFIAGGCKWRLLLCPESTCYDNVDYMSIYLYASRSDSLPEGWSREVEFSLAVVNQFDKSATVTREFRHVFCIEHEIWGCPLFIPLNTIKHPAERYLVDDNLTVEAVIVVLSAVHYSKVQNEKKVTKSKPKKAPKVAVGAPPNHTPPTVVKQELIGDVEANLAAPVVPDASVKAEPSNRSKGASEPEHGMPVSEGTKIHSKDESPVRTTSKRLLEELSSRRKKHKPIFSNEILGSSQAPESTTDFQQQQKEALRGFFKMSLEAIQQANCFVKIEEILQALVQDTNDTQEKTTLEDIISRLTNFKRRIYNAKEIAETVEARRSSLAGKSADLDSKLEQRQRELNSMESELSTLSDREEKLRAEIDQVLTQKKSASVKLERANEETCKEIEEWKNLEAEMKKINTEWVGAKEKLASANVHWDLFRKELGL